MTADVVALYEESLAQRGFVSDPAQWRAVERLQRLYEEWSAYKARRNTALKRLLVHPELPKGVYLWGPVGRGKSFLMDAFYRCVPLVRKRRVHFHHFVREIHRVLRPNGVLYVELPFLEGFHADPDDYQRFTFRGLDVLLRRFEILDREVCSGPNSALNWILREYPAAWFRNPGLALAAKFVAAWVTAPIRYLNYAMASRPGAFRIAVGLSAVARRRNEV